MKNLYLNGEKISLKKLSLETSSKDYLSWLYNYNVIKFTEARLVPKTQSDVVDFIENGNDFKNFTFGIFHIKDNIHIGNIKLGNINWVHRFADIGLIIGDTSYWGQGIATEAISLIINYSFNFLNLRKLYAGAYNVNTNSIKAFKKNGFTISHIEKNKYFFEGNYVDAVVLEITSPFSN
jgi:[ribosomal protein S5]-alanine N-acetyltransferase